MASLDDCGKSHPHLHFIPGPSNPQRVAISTTLSRLSYLRANLLVKISHIFKPSITSSYKQHLDINPLLIGLNAVHNLIHYFPKISIFFNHTTGIFLTVLISTYLSRIFHRPLLIGVTVLNAVHTRSLFTIFLHSVFFPRPHYSL